MLFGRPLLVCSAGVLRREAVARLAGFDPDVRLTVDADFYAPVMRTCGADVIDDVVLHYRIGFPSLMHARDPPRARGLEFYALAAFTRFLVQRL